MQGHNLGDGQQVFGGRLHRDVIRHKRRHLRVACVGNGNHLGALRLHVAQKFQRFLIAEDRGFERTVNGGHDDQRHAVADQRIWPMLQFAHRVALGMNIRSFLELQGSLTRDSVVNATAEEEKGVGGAVLVCQGGHLVAPAVELHFDAAGEGLKPGNVGRQLRSIHASQALRFIEAQKKQHGQLASKALGGGDRLLDASAQRHGNVCLARHGGGLGIGDGQAVLSAPVRLPQGRQRVGGLARLR